MRFECIPDDRQKNEEELFPDVKQRHTGVQFPPLENRERKMLLPSMFHHSVSCHSVHDLWLKQSKQDTETLKLDYETQVLNSQVKVLEDCYMSIRNNTQLSFSCAPRTTHMTTSIPRGNGAGSVGPFSLSSSLTSLNILDNCRDPLQAIYESEKRFSSSSSGHVTNYTGFYRSAAGTRAGGADSGHDDDYGEEEEEDGVSVEEEYEDDLLTYGNSDTGSVMTEDTNSDEQHRHSSHHNHQHHHHHHQHMNDDDDDDDEIDDLILHGDVSGGGGAGEDGDDDEDDVLTFESDHQSLIRRGPPIQRGTRSSGSDGDGCNNDGSTIIVVGSGMHRRSSDIAPVAVTPESMTSRRLSYDDYSSSSDVAFLRRGQYRGTQNHNSAVNRDNSNIVHGGVSIDGHSIPLQFLLSGQSTQRNSRRVSDQQQQQPNVNRNGHGVTGTASSTSTAPYSHQMEDTYLARLQALNESNMASTPRMSGGDGGMIRRESYGSDM